MIKLVPSKQVQEYLDSIHFTFSDFEKATLIWNNHLTTKEEKLMALKEMMNSTKDKVLKKQIYERLDYEQKVYVDFMDDADDEYVYSIENSLGFARCKKVKDAIEYCLKLSDAELEKVTIVKYEAKDLFHIDEEDIVARADFNEKKELCIYSKILDLAIKYCSLSDEQRFIIIKSRKDIYSCTLQIIFNFPSTFENDIKESTSNIDKEFNTKSDISFDYNLKIVDIIFLMG